MLFFINSTSLKLYYLLIDLLNGQNIMQYTRENITSIFGEILRMIKIIENNEVLNSPKLYLPKLKKAW